jgi:hypothetical protein
MTYEWALLVIPGVILWDVVPALRPAWVRLFAMAWVALFVSTPLTRAQLALAGIALQISVPVLAWVALRADWLLINGTTGGASTCGEAVNRTAPSPRGI